MSVEQSNFFIALAIKPFVAFVLLFAAVLLGRWILSKLPEGRVKALLSRRVGP